MSKEQRRGEKSCPSGCGILYRTGNNLNDVSCPCSKGYWNRITTRFISGDDIRHHGAPTREQYHHHLQKCPIRDEHKAYYHGKDPEDCDLNQAGEIKDWGDYFLSAEIVEYDVFDRALKSGTYGNGALVKAITLESKKGWLLRCRKEYWDGPDSVAELERQTKLARSQGYKSKTEPPISFSGANIPSILAKHSRGGDKEDSISGNPGARHEVSMRPKREDPEAVREVATKSRSAGQAQRPDPVAALWTKFNEPKNPKEVRRRELVHNGKAVVIQEKNERGPMKHAETGHAISQDQLNRIAERILALTKTQQTLPEVGSRHGSAGHETKSRYSGSGDQSDSRHGPKHQSDSRRSPDRSTRVAADRDSTAASWDARENQRHQQRSNQPDDARDYDPRHAATGRNPTALFPKESGELTRTRDPQRDDASYNYQSRPSDRTQPFRQGRDTEINSGSYSQRSRNSAQEADNRPSRPLGRDGRFEPSEGSTPRYMPAESQYQPANPRSRRVETTGDEDSDSERRHGRHRAPVVAGAGGRGERHGERKYTR